MSTAYGVAERIAPLSSPTGMLHSDSKEAACER
jgi:hypothetical protein